MEYRTEGQLLAESVDIWYKDQFLDAILAKQAIPEEDRLPESMTLAKRWKNIFLTTIATLTLSTGPALPVFSQIHSSETASEIVRTKDCQTLTRKIEIICPERQVERSMGNFLPIPSRLPYINP